MPLRPLEEVDEGLRIILWTHLVKGTWAGRAGTEEVPQARISQSIQPPKQLFGPPTESGRGSGTDVPGPPSCPVTPDYAPGGVPQTRG